MTPTNRLRFVKREVSRTIESGRGYTYSEMIEVRVLQQWWAFDEGIEIGEWRDVPLEEGK